MTPLEVIHEDSKIKGKLATKLGEALEDFLTIDIPANILDIISEANSIQLLKNSDVRKILPEKEPQLFIDRASFLNVDHTRIVFATTHITDEMCRGHFPWYPIMPLAITAQCAGQAGEILVNLITEDKEKIPLAVDVFRTRSVSDKSKKRKSDFVTPGDDLLFAAIYKAGKLGFHKVTVDIYCDGSIVGKLEEISYILVAKDYFIKQKPSKN